MPVSVSLLSQITGEAEIFREQILALLQKPGLTRVRLAVAYARWEGIGLLSGAIDTFLKRGGLLETIFGAGNGVTTPDALYYGLLIDRQYPGQTWSGFIEDQFSNATFHSKYMEFTFAAETTLIIGSANLSGGGLSRNIETGTLISLPAGDAVEGSLQRYWDDMVALAAATTPEAIANLAARPGSGKERHDEVGGAKSEKPRTNAKSRAASKPLFKKILGLADLAPEVKYALLGDMTELTERPENLYVQLWQRETGGTNGNSGAAVQFPVATLGAFFGVGKQEKRQVRVDFPGETVRPTFIHIRNNTHRLRLTPIMNVPRPAILHLKRIGPDHYKGRFVPSSRYATTLASKCTRQSTKNSRRWGLE
jgi:hypothetical protein